MRSLDELPVELVVKIMSGASLEDILNVTRTSRFFRAIGCSSRSLWANAKDAERLPLPMGETLDTFDITSICRLATYATAISASWRGPVARPRRITHLVQHDARRRALFRITDHAAFLPGNQWLLLDMYTVFRRVYCLRTRESVPLPFRGRVSCYTYSSSNNGSSIILAVVSEPWDILLNVYTLQLDPRQHVRTAPRVRNTLSIRLSELRAPSHIDLKEPLVLVSFGSDLFIVNFQECSGIKLSLSLHPPMEEEQNEDFGTSWYRLKAQFHPERPLIVAEKVENIGTSIHVIDCPAVLYPLESSATDLTHESFIWPTELLVTTCIHTVDSEGSANYRGYRRGVQGPVIFDFIYSHGYWSSEHVSIIWSSDLGDPTLEATCRQVESPKRYTFERRTTAGRSLCLAINDSGGGSNNNSSTSVRHALFGGTSGPHRWIGGVGSNFSGAASRIQKLIARSVNHLFIRVLKRPVNRPNWLFFLRMPERSGSGTGQVEKPTWVRLKLPRGVLVNGIQSYSVLAFDDVYGTLLLDDKKGNYCLVQY